MKFVKSVVWDDEEKRVFEEAALAVHVGDNERERETKAVTSFVQDNSPITEARLLKCRVMLEEILEAVRFDLADFQERRELAVEAAGNPVERPSGVPLDHGVGVPLIVDPVEACDVILGARTKMERDVDAALALVNRALDEVVGYELVA